MSPLTTADEAACTASFTVMSPLAPLAASNVSSAVANAATIAFLNGDTKSSRFISFFLCLKFGISSSNSFQHFFFFRPGISNSLDFLKFACCPYNLVRLLAALGCNSG